MFCRKTAIGPTIVREFGIRRVEKKLVTSPTFCIFINENQISHLFHS